VRITGLQTSNYDSFSGFNLVRVPQLGLVIGVVGLIRHEPMNNF